jgi:hypothetical protein
MSDLFNIENVQLRGNILTIRQEGPRLIDASLIQESATPPKHAASNTDLSQCKKDRKCRQNRHLFVASSAECPLSP